MTRGIALVRRPSHRLAEGLVTHIERSDVDVTRARRQHEAYRAALAGAGWQVREVAPADDCPDSVFVEDTVVVCDGLAVLTRPGAPRCPTAASSRCRTGSTRPRCGTRYARSTRRPAATSYRSVTTSS